MFALLLAPAIGVHPVLAGGENSARTSSASPASIRPALIPSTCKKPEYPPDSLRANEAGVVLLKFLVDVDGNVAETMVERSSGYQRLDEAAKTALQVCKFKPGSE